MFLMNCLDECFPDLWNDLTMYEPWYFPWISYPVDFTVNKTACLQKYHLHVEDVVATVPKEQLLRMHISEGWKPLCNFLGLPIPSKPFPNSNSSQQLETVKKLFLFIATWYPFIALAVVATAFGGLYVLKIAFGKGWKLLRKQPKQKGE